MEVELFITALLVDKFVIVEEETVVVANVDVPVDVSEGKEIEFVNVAFVNVPFVDTKLIVFVVEAFVVEA